jgi:hypothetical protein
LGLDDMLPVPLLDWLTYSVKTASEAAVSASP